MNISKAALLQMLAGIILSASGAEFYEDFQGAPNLSEGWTYGETNNVKLSNYEGQNSSYRDKVTSAVEDLRSLKIERPEKLVDGVSPLLEIISPQTIENVRQYSFYCKRTAGDTTSDTISVYGRSNDAAEWIPLGEPIIVTTNNRWLTNSVPDSLGIHEIKFSFSAEPSSATFQNCAIDSLRVLTGENAPSDDDDDPVDPAEPTQPTNLKIEATAPDRIQATWQGVPGEDGYQVELFRAEDARETETPDFSGLGDGVWPSGWTHADSIVDSYVDKGVYSVKLRQHGQWVASPTYGKPITAYSFKIRGETKTDELANTFLVAEGSKTGADDIWKELGRTQVTSSMVTVDGIADAAEEYGKIRFKVDYTGSDTKYAYDGIYLNFRVLSVTCGTVETMRECSRTVADSPAVFSNLDATASYFVTVGPMPSDNPELVATSDILDLSKEHFRRTGAFPVTLENLTYEERFDSLSNFVSQTKTAKMNLDYWQFVLDRAEPPALGASQTNTVPNNAGCYVCRDKERISDIDSAMIGTLASGEKGCAIGLALRNDTDRALKNPTMTFDLVQRSSTVNPASYAFEWRIADGEASIAEGSDWQQVSIPQAAPITSEKKSSMTEFRQRDVVATIPARVPAGKVLLIRWRHPAMTSGPMMAIDNVRITFVKPGGFLISIK